MKNTVNPRIGKLMLFILGELLVFGFICLLQFVDAKERLAGFILTLLGMHCGIVCFILSKRLFKVELNLKKHYVTEYILLALYIPIVIVSIAGVEIPRTVKLSIVFSLTALSVIVSIINTIKLALKLQ